VNVDREEEAGKLIDLFRVDVILPIGDSVEVKEFTKKFPHLIKPFFSDALFIKDSDYHPWSTVLDVYNALIYLQDKPEWKEIKDRGIRLFTWQHDDPLADCKIRTILDTHSDLNWTPIPEKVGQSFRF
jgi:hypothetical protein